MSPLIPFNQHRRKCSICGEPIHFGYTHDRCKLTNNPEGSRFEDLRIAMDRFEKKVREELGKKVKRWNKKMGREARDEMFPDWIDRP